MNHFESRMQARDLLTSICVFYCINITLHFCVVHIIQAYCLKQNCILAKIYALPTQFQMLLNKVSLPFSVSTHSYQHQRQCCFYDGVGFPAVLSSLLNHQSLQLTIKEHLLLNHYYCFHFRITMEKNIDATKWVESMYIIDLSLSFIALLPFTKRDLQFLFNSIHLLLKENLFPVLEKNDFLRRSNFS